MGHGSATIVSGLTCRMTKPRRSWFVLNLDPCVFVATCGSHHTALTAHGQVHEFLHREDKTTPVSIVLTPRTTI